MTTPDDRSDAFLRFSRRGMWIVLLLILALGGSSLAMTLQPDGAVTHAFARLPWLLPFTIVVAVAALQTTQRRNRFTPDSPEVKAVMNDEWRRLNLERARAIAFIVILIVQFPLALLLAQSPRGLGFHTQLPAFQAVMAMAVATITLGMSVFIISFLILDRE